MREKQREEGRSERRSELRMGEDRRERPSDELRISFRSMKMTFQPFSPLGSVKIFFGSVNFNPQIRYFSWIIWDYLSLILLLQPSFYAALGLFSILGPMALNFSPANHFQSLYYLELQSCKLFSILILSRTSILQICSKNFFLMNLMKFVAKKIDEFISNKFMNSYKK